MPEPPKIPQGRVIDPARHGTISDVRLPARNGQGQPITQKPLENAQGRVIAPTTNNITIINNNTTINNITNIQNNHWNRNDHGYYEHHWRGPDGWDYDVWHHYDGYGYHWWGFYIGPVYFWTRYYDDYYWWYDPYWHRWCYMHDGRWWWRDPVYVERVYVYTDNGYYRYEDSTGGVVMRPDPTPPVVAPPADPTPAPEPQPVVYTSLDGTRIVTVSADGKQTAYLSDTADPPAFQPVWLGDGVTSVRFKVGADGHLAQVLTLTSDGGFGLFDQNGYSLTNPPAAQPKVYTSPDGSRTVTVSADGTSTAVLADTANPPTIEPVTLGTGVTDVKFKVDDQGVLSQIVVITSDGGFNAFTRDGVAIAAPAPAAPLGDPNAPASPLPSSMGQSLMNSSAFKALGGSLGW